MNLKLTDKQIELQNKFREICRKEISQRAEELDKEENFSFENWKTLKDFGFFKTPYPEKWGGYKDTILFSILTEELSYVCASTGCSASLPLMECGMSILEYGKEEIKNKYLSQIISGEKICAFALTEEETGSDFLSLKTSAEKRNGYFLLKGKKSFVINGNIADIILIFAKTSDGKISAFLIERGTDGVIFGEKISKMGIRGCPVCEIVFDGCKVQEENLIYGDKMIDFVLSCGKIAVASWCVGLAQSALDESIKHSERRYVFGKPIGYFQEINHKIADMKVLIDTARQLVLYTSWLKDTGEEFRIFSSIAKLFAVDTALKCCNWAVEIYGGRGLIKGSKVERIYRDAKFGEVLCGTQQMQRNIICEELLKD